MRVYLAGPHMDDEWRVTMTGLLAPHGVDVFDPIAARDFRGKEIENEDVIVYGDLEDVAKSDVICGNFTVPGWGTGMETWFAHSIHRHIVAYVAPEARVSPWIAHVAGGWDRVCRSHKDAAGAVLSYDPRHDPFRRPR